MVRRRRPPLEETLIRPDRVVLYIRVSTDRQAENRLSLEEQEAQMRDHCERQGWTILGTYCDAGESASSVQRPQLQKMLAHCLDGSRSVDAVLVHSISRGFRNLVDQERTVLELAAHGVAVRSVTENIVDSQSGELVRLMLGLANQFKSHDARIGTMRGMVATAKLGFSNGGTTPYGYRSAPAKTIGRTTKHALEVDAVEAEVVRLVFRLALDGDGVSGPMGVRAIVQHLNASGYRTRKGGEFYSSTIHEMLIREAYTGVRSWNVFDKHGKQNPDDRIVDYEVPTIVDRETYDAVQAHLAERQPTRRGPRLDNAPSLFGGLIRCGCCGRAMSPATGTSRNGTIYRYYKCAGTINQSPRSCQIKAVGRDATEDRVMHALVQWLTTPDRLVGILEALHSRKASKQGSVLRRIAQLQADVAEADKSLQNVYRAIESGTLDPTEPSLQIRVRTLRERRDLASSAVERAKASLIDQPVFAPHVVEAFRSSLVERLINGPVEARKAWLGAVVDAIIVEPDKIRVVGRTDNFEKNLRSQAAGRGPVRSSDRKWWGKQDSNLRRHSQRIYSPPPLPLGTFPRLRRLRLGRGRLSRVTGVTATGAAGLMVTGPPPVNAKKPLSHRHAMAHRQFQAGQAGTVMSGHAPAPQENPHASTVSPQAGPRSAAPRGCAR